MTTLVSIEITCSCCGTTFDSKKVIHTNTLGPVTTDILEMAVGEQPLLFQVSTCPSCGYTRATTEDGPVDQKTRQFVEERITPMLGGPGEMEISSGRKWEFLAILQEAKGLDNFAVGSLYLRAVWCSSLDGRKADELEYRKKVIEYFQRAFEKDGVMENRLYWTTYLIGEMYRRIGDGLNARRWFDRVIALNQKQSDRDFWIKLAAQQKTEPMEYIRKPVSLALGNSGKPPLMKKILRLFKPLFLALVMFIRIKL
ncbi:hypothetical protein BMS3Abin14_00647 [bacterium BMS3Abin14]|nr:hypothetical protein BMS3Abin14_00647 [bacterium BMS3Abin14]